MIQTRQMDQPIPPVARATQSASVRATLDLARDLDACATFSPEQLALQRALVDSIAGDNGDRVARLRQLQAQGNCTVYGEGARRQRFDLLWDSAQTGDVEALRELLLRPPLPLGRPASELTRWRRWLALAPAAERALVAANDPETLRRLGLAYAFDAQVDGLNNESLLVAIHTPDPELGYRYLLLAARLQPRVDDPELDLAAGMAITALGERLDPAERDAARVWASQRLIDLDQSP